MSRVGNWVGQSTSSKGVGDLVLDGIIDGYAEFSSIGDGLVYYSISDGFNREAGTGILNGNTIGRSDIQATLVSGELTTIMASPIDLTGNALVFCTFNKQAFDTFTQTSGIGEAPIDGNSYVRNNSAWALIGFPVTSVSGKTGNVVLNKGDVGLDQVDNTSDLSKPISSATQTALDGKASSAQGGLADTSLQPGDNVSDLVNDSGFITSYPVDSVNGQTGVVSIAKADVGLGNADDTSDVDKPVSTLQQAALDDKLDIAGGIVTGRITLGDPDNFVETGSFNEATVASGVAVSLDAPAVVLTSASDRAGALVTIGSNGLLVFTDPPDPTVTWQDTDAGPISIPQSVETDAGVSVSPTQDVEFGSVEWVFDFQNDNNQTSVVTVQFYTNAIAAGMPVDYSIAANDLSRIYGSSPVTATIPNGTPITFTITATQSGSIVNSFIRLSEAGASTSASWGSITGTIGDQTDLQFVLDSKVANGDNVSELTNDALYISEAPNDSDSYVRSALGWIAEDKGSVAVSAHIAEPDPHPQYLTPEELPATLVSWFTNDTSTHDGAFFQSVQVKPVTPESSISVGAVVGSPTQIGQWLRETLFAESFTWEETFGTLQLDIEASGGGFTGGFIYAEVYRWESPSTETFIARSNNVSIIPGRGTYTVPVVIEGPITMEVGDSAIIRLFAEATFGTPTVELFMEGGNVSRSITSIPINASPNIPDDVLRSTQSIYQRSAVSTSITGGGAVFPFATSVSIDTNLFSYSAGAITVLVTGRYKVNVDLGAFNNVLFQLRLNGTNIPGALAYLYTAGGTPGSSSLFHVLDATAGQTIEVFANTTSGDTVSVQNASRFFIERA